MTLSEPRIGIIDFGSYEESFWPYRDVVSSVYQPGMTADETIEEIRRWISRKLVPYLRANFQSLESSWESQVGDLTTRVTASIADAITAISEADIPITDPVVMALLNSANTQVREYLDANYLAKAKNKANAFTGWFHVDDFGAKGDGTTHDEAACQAAIEAANAAYLASNALQRVYFTAGKTYLIGNSNQNQNPSWGLMLKSGVELCGRATLKTAPGTIWVGTDWAIVRSPAEGASNLGIVDLRFDGDKSRYTGVPGGNDAIKSCNNITLGPVQGAWIRNVVSVESAASGIMVAGRSSNLVKDLLIANCDVSNCNVIGIQVSQFDGIEIIDNKISWCQNDNAIDIYGEPESHTGGSTGMNFKISGNKINDCANGIFPETVARGIISNNHMRNLGDAGIHVNRINAEPHNILIDGNYIFGCQSGVIVTGDTGGITIRANEIEWFNTAGVTLAGSSTTRVSQVYIIDNIINGNSLNQPLVLVPAANQVAGIIIKDNLTKNRNRALDFVNNCTNSSSITAKAAISPGDTIA